MPDKESLETTSGPAIGRRGFLKAATLAGTGAIAPCVTSAVGAVPGTETPTSPQPDHAAGQAPHRRHNIQLTARDAEQAPPPPVTATQTTCGSDFMIDVMRNLGIEYVAAIPGNTFKGRHESVINYGMTSSPRLELISCMHEEMSVAIAHGYAKVAPPAQKPLQPPSLPRDELLDQRLCIFRPQAPPKSTSPG